MALNDTVSKPSPERGASRLGAVSLTLPTPPISWGRGGVPRASAFCPQQVPARFIYQKALFPVFLFCNILLMARDIGFLSSLEINSFSLT